MYLSTAETPDSSFTTRGELPPLVIFEVEMAGDWMAWTKGLARKPEVLKIARAIGQHRLYVAAAMMEFWEWIEENTVDGCVDGVAPHDVGAILPEMTTKFIDAICDAGWLSITTKGIMIPNFQRWMGDNAKQRLKKSRRQARWRNGGVDGGVDGHVDARAPTRREEKRREEKRSKEINTSPAPPDVSPKPQTTIPESLNTAQFLESWSAWERHRKEKRQTLTPTAIGRQLLKLSEMGEKRAIAAIEHSIANGYTGIFEPNTPGTPKNGPSDAFGHLKEGYGPPETLAERIDRLYAERQKRENSKQQP